MQAPQLQNFFENHLCSYISAFVFRLFINSNPQTKNVIEIFSIFLFCVLSCLVFPIHFCLAPNTNACDAFMSFTVVMFFHTGLGQVKLIPNCVTFVQIYVGVFLFEPKC